MLSPGIHEYNIINFKEIFVDSFTTSQNRVPIFEMLVNFFQEVFSYGIPDEVWIDGSYVTSKINPNDVH